MSLAAPSVNESTKRVTETDDGKVVCQSVVLARLILERTNAGVKKYLNETGVALIVVQSNRWKLTISNHGRLIQN
jgi:hypothetical protein